MKSTISSSSNNTLTQPAVTITIPTALQKAMIPSSSEAPSSTSSRTSSTANTGTPAFYHNGQMYVLPSTSTTLRNLSVANFIDGLVVSAVGEAFINRVLIRKEDLAAFSVDVVATYPAIAAEYEKLCPRMLDLGTMKTLLAAPLPSSTEDLGNIPMSPVEDAVVSEKYSVLLLRKINSDISTSSSTTTTTTSDGSGNGRQLVETASLPLIIAMFSSCYPRVHAAAKTASFSSKGGVTSRVSTRGRNATSDDAAVTPTDSTVGSFSAVDESLFDACADWLKGNVIEPLTQRLSDQVDLIAGNCLTFNASNTNTFFVDHAADLKTFTVQKALPAFRARWQEFLCSKWLRNSVVAGVLGELVKQYRGEAGSIASPNTSSPQEYLKGSSAPSSGLSQQFVETPPMTQNPSQKSYSGTTGASSSSQPHKSLFKKGAAVQPKSTATAPHVDFTSSSSASLATHFDTVLQGSKAANLSSSAPVGPATTAQSRQERNRLLQAMSSSKVPHSTSTQKSSISNAVAVSSSPEAVFKVPEVLRSFLVAKHLHKGAIAAQLAAWSSSSSEFTDLFGKQPRHAGTKPVGVNPYSVFCSSRKSVSANNSSADDQPASTITNDNDIVAFVCDEVLEKRFSTETVAQVLEGFYCHRVAMLKKNNTSSSLEENTKESGGAAAHSTSSFERAQTLHNQTALRELRELLELIINVFEKAVSMPVLLYGYEMSELYRSHWWAQAVAAAAPTGHASPSSVKVEGSSSSTINHHQIGTKRPRDGVDGAVQQPIITPLSFQASKNATTGEDASSEASWQFAQVCSCEYLVRLLVWLPQIVKVMLGGGGKASIGISGGSGGGAQWAAAALASQVVTPLVEELLEWIHTA